jgi:hypothetical protein
VLVLLVAAGCGRDSARLAPVSGRVTYQGRPLAGGTIVFTPNPERGGSGPMAYAEIQADGSFTLRTQREFGAVPGWHRVTVAAIPAPAVPGSAVPPEATRLPAKYSDPERSGLHQEVKAGLANTCDIRLD